jgi:hypothetical protein
VPGTAGGQDVQDTVEQAAGVTPGSADMRLRWRKVFPDNRSEIIVNFPESHDSEYHLKGPIILGPPQSEIEDQEPTLIHLHLPPHLRTQPSGDRHSHEQYCLIDPTWLPAVSVVVLVRGFVHLRGQSAPGAGEAVFRVKGHRHRWRTRRQF